MIRLVQINRDAATAEPIPESTPLSQEVLAANASFYRRSGFEPPWVAYLAVDKEHCVGTCAFKGPPHENRVENASTHILSNLGFSRVGTVDDDEAGLVWEWHLA